MLLNIGHVKNEEGTDEEDAAVLIFVFFDFGPFLQQQLFLVLISHYLFYFNKLVFKDVII